MTSLVDLRAKTRNEYIKIDPAGKIWNNSTLDALINRAYFQVQAEWQHRRPMQYANYSINTVNGTELYSLPSDYIKMEVPTYNYQSLVRTDKSALKRSLNWPITQGTPYAYYTYGTSIGLYPIPSWSGILDIEYYKKLPRLTESQDSVLPEDFDDAIATYTAYLAFDSVSKNDKSAVMRASYNSIIGTLLQSYISNDMNMSYSYQRAWYSPSDTSTLNIT